MIATLVMMAAAVAVFWIFHAIGYRRRKPVGDVSAFVGREYDQQFAELIASRIAGEKPGIKRSVGAVRKGGCGAFPVRSLE